MAFKTPAMLYSTGLNQAGQDCFRSRLGFGRKITLNVTGFGLPKVKSPFETGFETCWAPQPSKSTKRNSFSQSFFAALLGKFKLGSSARIRLRPPWVFDVKCSIVTHGHPREARNTPRADSRPRIKRPQGTNAETIAYTGSGETWSTNYI